MSRIPSPRPKIDAMVREPLPTAVPAPIPLIHNPAARSERSARLHQLLERLEPAPRILATDGPGSARALATGCARDGCPVVACAGGDGTVNEVVAGLLDAHRQGIAMPVLGLMPVGTMNVFAFELGLPVRNLRQCWQAIVCGQTREVDLWMANDLPLVQLGGVGLDAAIVAETTWDMKRKFGPLSYVVNAARLLSRPPPLLQVTVDGQRLEGALALLGNGRHYGGVLKVFPGACQDDGLLDVLVLRKQTPGDMLGFLAALATGGIGNFPGVWLGRGAAIDITSATPVPVELDGESAGLTPLQIRPAGCRMGVRVAG